MLYVRNRIELIKKIESKYKLVYLFDLYLFPTKKIVTKPNKALVMYVKFSSILHLFFLLNILQT